MPLSECPRLTGALARAMPVRLLWPLLCWLLLELRWLRVASVLRPRLVRASSPLLLGAAAAAAAAVSGRGCVMARWHTISASLAASSGKRSLCCSQ
jgi:hypothetical protein